jgi:hypothetical protein
MIQITGQNYARKTDIQFSYLQFKECNFSQEIPGTVLNIENCQFIECNLVNCSLPESNGIINCNTSQTEVDNG